jgi:ribosomal protein L30/L7E
MGQDRYRFRRFSSNVQIADIERVVLNELASRFDHIAHEAGEHLLGLDRIGDTNLLPDNPAVRGMVRQVNFLVSVDELTGAEAATAATAVATKKAQKAKKPAKVKKAKVTK